MKKVLMILISVLIANAVLAKDTSPVRQEGIAGGWPEIQTSEGSNAKPVKEKVMMVSWGDVVFMYGPETDAGVATPEQIRNMMRYWKNNGFTQIFWRGEDARDPNFVWNESTIYAEGSFIQKETARVMQAFDTTAVAIQAAHDLGMKIYMWQSVFDDGTPPNKPHRFWADRFPWRNTFFDGHPELEVRDRSGNVQWGIRELAYPLCRSTKINDYINVIKKYPQLDGVYIYFHSHSAAGFHGDQYGFNQIIADEYKKRYGIDILIDPRFDYKDPKFNAQDEAVEKWRALRGESITQFLREMKESLLKVRPGIRIAVNTQGGDYMGPPFGNIKTDWRTWIKEGLTDELIVRTWMAGAAGAYDFSKEGYLTWGDGNVGVTPYSDIRKVIESSGRDVKLITRSRVYIEGADGFYDSSNRDEKYPKKQRMIQLEQNLTKYGKIGFIEQDFDNCMPLSKTGCLDFTYGGKRYFVGDMRYFASTNTSPGFAGPLTTDANISPALVNSDVIGCSGYAVMIDEKGKPFNIHRRTGAGWPDEPVADGKIEIRFDLYRAPASQVGIETVTVNAKAARSDIAVMIDKSGKVVAARDQQTGCVISEEVRTPVTLVIDFAKGSYSVETAGKISQDISFNKDNAAFNGLNFRCYRGSAYVDNVQIYMLKM